MKDFPSDCLPILLGEVIKLHFKETHKTLDKLGLYPGQPPVLFYLRSNNGAKQNIIAAHLNIKPSSINVMINRMVNSGFIEKKADVSDKRSTNIYITQKGLDVCEQLGHIFINISNQYTENFTNDEKELFITYLKRLRDNLKHTPDKGDDLFE